MTLSKNSALVLGALGVLTSICSSAMGAPSLSSRLDAVLAKRSLKRAQISFHVVDADNGRVLFSKNPALALNPASGVKLVTSVVALDVFGSGHQFDTTVWAEQIDAGVVSGDLYLKGGGDPGLRMDGLWRLAHLVARAGIKEVKGGLVVDVSLFDDARLPPFFDTKDTDSAYRAAVGALAVEDGAYLVRVVPSTVEGKPLSVSVDPPGAPVTIDNRGMTLGGKFSLAVSSVARGGGDAIVVRGNVPADGRMRTVRRRSAHPDAVAAATFRWMLEREGVKIAGPTGWGVVPAKARRLALLPSAPLSALVKDMNTWSSNFKAEMLLKNIGAKAAGMPGTWEKGLKAVRRRLGSLGLPEGTYRYGNGSGLYDANRFSSRDLTTLLLSVYRAGDAVEDLVASLAVGGRPGTLRRRLRAKDIGGRVRAKTGTLDRAVSLTGFIRTRRHRVLVFSFLINGMTIGSGRALLDAMVETLARAEDIPKPNSPRQSER